MLFPTSKLKRKLLIHFFSHPNEVFYVRELSKLIGEDEGNLSRALRALEAGGIFQTTKEGKAKYYCLKKDNPMINEIKDIVYKVEGIEGSLKDMLGTHEGIDYAFIYGPYIKEAERSDSEINVVVVGAFPGNEFMDQVDDLEKKIERKINISSYRREEFDHQKEKQGTLLNTILKDEIVVLKDKLKYEWW